MATRRARRWAAFGMVLSAGNGLLFNLWHAYETGLADPLAAAFGTVPVLLAAAVSVIAEEKHVGPLVRALVWAVMLGTIALSVVAQYGVLYAAIGNMSVAILYPAVCDIATIVCLNVLIGDTAAVADKATLPVSPRTVSAPDVAPARVGVAAPVSVSPPARQATGDTTAPDVAPAPATPDIVTDTMPADTAAPADTEPAPSTRRDNTRKETAVVAPAAPTVGQADIDALLVGAPADQKDRIPWAVQLVTLADTSDIKLTGRQVADALGAATGRTFDDRTGQRLLMAARDQAITKAS
ncbi:hypothetical protein GCM10022221_68370 [Actinocorallia aurea]